MERKNEARIVLALICNGMEKKKKNSSTNFILSSQLSASVTSFAGLVTLRRGTKASIATPEFGAKN